MRGSSKLASSFPFQLLKDRWSVVVVSFFIMSCAGATYMFGLYSGVIKKALSYDQETLDTLGFFKDLGANVGIISGLLNEVTPAWAVIAVGAGMNLFGYLMVWLAVTGRIARPPLWQMYTYICVGANSQTFANTGVIVTCVKNFPRNRGIVIGLLKGFVGLSGAILTQIYHALYGEDASSVILLVGWLPALISLLFMFFIRPMDTPPHDTSEKKLLYSFLVSSLVLAGFLMVVIIIENQIRISIDIYRAMAAITVFIIVLNVGFVIKDLGERRRGLKDPSPKEVELGGSNNGSEESKLSEKASDPNAQIAHQDVEVLPSTNNGEEHRSKWPKRGDDFTIPQALISLDMWILFIATTCGVGAALTAIDNLGQIGESLGYSKTSISTFVSLVSIWNFLGRVVAGCVSEILLQRYKLPRPLMMSAVLGIACVAHLLIAFGMPGCLYVASIIIGFCFGAQWPVLFAVISELFGLKYYATLYNCGAAASPLGSYLLSVRVAGFLYDREARKQQHLHLHLLASSSLPSPSAAPSVSPSMSDVSCHGVICFRTTFTIMAAVSFFGCLTSLFLAFRTRHFYRQDIYEKFRRTHQRRVDN